jgi:hypothetical protein
MRELSLEEKKACITYMINTLISRKEEFICHCFTEFVKTETDINGSEFDAAEDFMHIIFPELYNELRSLVVDDTDLERYNANGNRMGGVFEKSYKHPIWFSEEIDERVHFLKDLNNSLK